MALISGWPVVSSRPRISTTKTRFTVASRSSWSQLARHHCSAQEPNQKNSAHCQVEQGTPWNPPPVENLAASRTPAKPFISTEKSPDARPTSAGLEHTSIPTPRFRLRVNQSTSFVIRPWAQAIVAIIFRSVLIFLGRFSAGSCPLISSKRGYVVGRHNCKSRAKAQTSIEQKLSSCLLPKTVLLSSSSANTHYERYCCPSEPGALVVKKLTHFLACINHIRVIQLNLYPCALVGVGVLVALHDLAWHRNGTHALGQTKGMSHSDTSAHRHVHFDSHALVRNCLESGAFRTA